MKENIRIVSSILLSATLSGTALGADTLFHVERSKSVDARSVPVHGVVDEAPVSLHASTLQGTTEELAIELLDGYRHVATNLRYVRYAPDWEVWSGALRRDDFGPAEGYVLLSRFEGRLSAIIHAANAMGGTDHYQLLTESSVDHAARKSNSPPSTDRHFLLRVQHTAQCPVEHANGAAGIVDSWTAPESAKIAGFSRGNVTIDVMSLYTREFLASQTMENAARSFITTAFSAANDIFMNSRTGKQPQIQYRLVHMAPIPDTSLDLPLDPDDTGTLAAKAITIAREWLNDGPTLTTQMRDAFGADMVALWIPLVEDTVDDACGIANLPFHETGQAGAPEVFQRYPGGLEPFNGKAFTAQEVGCGQTDLTYAHEHGHNYGMLHDISDAHNYPAFPIDDAGKGHTFTSSGPRASVMGCNRDGSGTPTTGVCNRVPFWSNPDKEFAPGVPTGTVNANNAALVAQRSKQYAGFRQSINQAAPALNIFAPADGVSVSSGTSVSFSASASDAEDGNIGSQIQWVSDIEGALGSGSSLTTPLFVSGNHIITAIVTDSGGKRVEQSRRVSVSGNAEIRVHAGGATISDGGSYSFGTHSVDNLPVSTLFYVCNDGTGGLQLDNPTTLVSGSGFTQIGTPPQTPVPAGQCTTFRVRFNVANPGQYAGAITIQNNDANENPYNIALAGTSTESAVQLVATFTNAANGPQISYGSSSNSPPEQEIYFDPNLGRFEQRPGGTCSNNGRPENPTYLKLTLGGSILNTGGIDSCTYGASWDNTTSIPCTASVLATLNAGSDIIINTDDHFGDAQTCGYGYPLQPHVGYGEPHWMQVNFVVGNQTYTRRFRFRQTADVRHYAPTDDTYVSQTLPTNQFGNASQLQVRNASTGDGKYVFTRFHVQPPVFPTVGSAHLYLTTVNNPISQVDLHRVCGNNWTETGLTWNNWGAQTGGSCGVIESRTNLAGNRSIGFDVTAEFPLFHALTRSFGVASSDTRTNRAFGSSENSSGKHRPVLVITYDR